MFYKPKDCLEKINDDMEQKVTVYRTIHSDIIMYYLLTIPLAECETKTKQIFQEKYTYTYILRAAVMFCIYENVEREGEKIPKFVLKATFNPQVVMFFISGM